jgi:hypothetical protein
MRKYGVENFAIMVWCYVEQPEEGDRLSRVEKLVISLHNSMVPHGYNLTPGGRGIDFSNPLMKARHDEGIRRRSANPVWWEVIARRSADPQWQKLNAEALHKAHTDPAAIQAQLDGIRAKFAEPEYRAGQAEKNRKMAKDPKWQEANRKALARTREDPDLKEVYEQARLKAWAATRRKWDEKDTLLEPAELEHLQRRRSNERRSVKRKKMLASGLPLPDELVIKPQFVWPSDEVLSALVQAYSMNKVGKLLGVSNVSVGVRCRKQGIPIPDRRKRKR